MLWWVSGKGSDLQAVVAGTQLGQGLHQEAPLLTFPLVHLTRQARAAHTYLVGWGGVCLWGPNSRVRGIAPCQFSLSTTLVTGQTAQTKLLRKLGGHPQPCPRDPWSSHPQGRGGATPDEHTPKGPAWLQEACPAATYCQALLWTLSCSRTTGCPLLGAGDSRVARWA